MKDHGSKEWMWPPADQVVGVWGVLIIAFVAIATSWILAFFGRLTGMPWICSYFVALGIALAGACLIFYAKLPLYRQRRFFTFGSRALPEKRRPFYRWGYRCAVLGILMLACLSISKH